MARLFAAEKEMKTSDVIRLLRTFQLGLSESEIADALGWDRRTANNHLRNLENGGHIYKEGRLWYTDE